MSTTEQQPIPPIVRAPWCAYGDRHTNAIFREDQTCMGEQHITPASDDDDDAGELSVLAYRWVAACGRKCVSTSTLGVST
jgi:hypothetical protein